MYKETFWQYLFDREFPLKFSKTCVYVLFIFLCSFLVTRGSTQPLHRRRLGRSPSPPQLRVVTEQSRGTNTPSSAGKFLAKDASKTALKEVLSRLKCEYV